jgi:hypothetical protein
MYCLMQQKMQILHLNNHRDLEIKEDRMEIMNEIIYLVVRVNLEDHRDLACLVVLVDQVVLKENLIFNLGYK